MYSVRQRISTVMQPRGGYLEPRLFTSVKLPDDNIDIMVRGEDSRLTGLAVDYLTRFVAGQSALDAFAISLQGASCVQQETLARQLIATLDRQLDNQTIINAYRLCGYDVAYRQSPVLFCSLDTIEVTPQIINNVRTLVNRTVAFLDQQGGITDSGLTFEGAYNDIISSGDCDFLTPDTLWDLKVSSNPRLTTKYTLQLLIYFILGRKSIHSERFMKIKKLGIINPLAGVAYVISLEDQRIHKGTLYRVCTQVIGYDVIDHRFQGTNQRVLAEAKAQKTFYLTNFDPKDYRDGIYDISIDDYCTYYYPVCLTMSGGAEWQKPKFKYTKTIKFLKHDGFLMFITVTPKGRLSVLRGGQRRNLTRDVQYYYQNLPTYAHQVLKIFSSYWNSLYRLSDELKQLDFNVDLLKKQYRAKLARKATPQESFEHYADFIKVFQAITGRVHGTIVDLNFENHIYVNPLDGKVSAYCAPIVKERDVYSSVGSLIQTHFPLLYGSYQQKLEENDFPLLTGEGLKLISATDIDAATDDQEDAATTHMTGTDMYKASNQFYYLQSIYDFHLVTVWNQKIMDSISEISE